MDITFPLTWISGPSATIDSEPERVEGVHCLRQLDVIIVKGLQSPRSSNNSLPA